MFWTFHSGCSDIQDACMIWDGLGLGNCQEICLSPSTQFGCPDISAKESHRDGPDTRRSQFSCGHHEACFLLGTTGLVTIWQRIVVSNSTELYPRSTPDNAAALVAPTSANTDGPGKITHSFSLAMQHCMLRARGLVPSQPDRVGQLHLNGTHAFSLIHFLTYKSIGLSTKTLPVSPSASEALHSTPLHLLETS